MACLTHGLLVGWLAKEHVWLRNRMSTLAEHPQRKTTLQRNMERRFKRVHKVTGVRASRHWSAASDLASNRALYFVDRPISFFVILLIVMAFFQGYQFNCWCGDETQEVPHVWWSKREFSICMKCQRPNEALDTEWCRGTALYQCMPCRWKWCRLDAHFCDYELCKHCKRHRAPLFIAPNHMGTKWVTTPLHKPAATPYAFRAANAVVVTHHSKFTLDDFLRNDRLMEVFGRHLVARLAGHWMVLDWHPEHEHKGFVTWDNAEGVEAVRRCRIALGLSCK